LLIHRNKAAGAAVAIGTAAKPACISQQVQHQRDGSSITVRLCRAQRLVQRGCCQLRMPKVQLQHATLQDGQVQQGATQRRAADGGRRSSRHQQLAHAAPRRV